MLFFTRFLRRISRLLTLVMLLTVFSPSFGWEAVDGVAPHEHVEIVLPGDGDVAGIDDHYDHHAALADAHEMHHGTASSDLENHCCPGHVLGHLLGGIGATTLPVLTPGGSLAVDGSNRAFSTRVPEGLERPPRPAA